MSNTEEGAYKQYKRILNLDDFKRQSGDSSKFKSNMKWIMHVTFLTIRNILIYISNKYNYLTYAGNRFTVILFILFLILTSLYIFALTGTSIFKQMETNNVFVMTNLFLFGLLALVGYTIIDGANKDSPSRMKYRDSVLWEANKVNFGENAKAFASDYFFGFKNTIALTGILGTLIAFYFVMNIMPSTTNDAVVKMFVPLTIFIGVSFALFVLLPRIPFIKTLLQTPVIKLIFNIILFIPCLFFEAVNAIYNQNLKTPSIVYKILFVQIVFVIGYFVLPLINNLTYTTVKKNRDPTLILESKIKSSMVKTENLNRRLKNILNHTENRVVNNAITEKSTAVAKLNNIEPIPQSAWERIIEKKWHTKADNTMKLRLIEYLSDYGYVVPESYNQTCYIDGTKKDTPECRKDINKMIEYIQEKAPEYINIKQRLGEEIEVRENAEKELKKLKKESAFFENGKILVNEPLPLNKKNEVIIPENLITRDNLYNAHYNYCVSMWLFIKSTPPNHTITTDGFVEIMSFDGQPKLDYNIKRNELRVSMVKTKNPMNIITKEPDDLISTIHSVPLQRWNNIVINYDGGTYDLFFNKQLIANYKNITPIVGVRNVTVGKEKGMEGGLCNLTYFPWHLSKNRIAMNYDSLKNKSPPILGNAKIVSKIR